MTPWKAMWVALAVGCGGRERDCADGADDDGDGFADCRDQDCAAECGEKCGNLVDDDGDGKVDDLDRECSGGGGTVSPEACTNATDDDGDWLADCLDPDCRPTCDADADGWLAPAVGGPDCDDQDPAVHPEADEVPYDGQDDDCDPSTPDDDVDQDGFLLAEDCDDANAWAYPGAPETCGDGVVDDCDAQGPPPDRDVCFADRSVATNDAELLGGSNDGWAGQSVTALGDVDDDGTPDLGIGAYGENQKKGAVYVVLGPVTGTVDLSQAVLKWTGESEDDWAGFSIAGGSDLTGDGRPDVAIGARYEDHVGNSAGAVYVARTDLAGTLELSAAQGVVFAEAIYDSLGYSVATPGDVDGDTQHDLLVGAHLNSSQALNAGSAYVVPGPVLGPVELSIATYAFRGEFANDNAGCAVGAAGDLDGDGRGDVLVGACLSDRTESNAGAAYQFSALEPGEYVLGMADGAIVGEAQDDQLGFAVAGGDLDDDGLSDAVVGAPFHDGAGADAGAVYVSRGPATTAMNTPDATLFGEASGDEAGASVAVAGDVDGDGIADLLIGAPGSDAGAEDGGAAYLLFGPVAGFASLADAPARLSGAAAFDFVGQSVAGAGDVDVDGFVDVVVGAPFHDGLAPAGGAVYLFTFDL